MANTALESATNKTNDAAARMQDSAVDYGREAMDAIDAKRDSAAHGLKKVASTLHAGADKVGSSVSAFAHTGGTSTIWRRRRAG